MPLTLLVSNNANSVLAASINATSTTLSVNTGAGSLFPAVVAGQSFFKLTIVDAATGQLNEIVHVTARNGDVFTILRGQEGTVARAWSANDLVANMLTAGTIRYLVDGITNLPVASLTQAGITQLSSATDSDAENVAATPKAVKDALANAGNVKTVNTVVPDNAGNVQLTAGDVGAVPTNAEYYSTKAGAWQGGGAFADQYRNQTAPFVIPVFTVQKDVSTYLPIAKGISVTNGYGFGSAVSFGSFRSGGSDFGSAVIQIIGDNGTDTFFTFNSADGSLSAPGALYAGKAYLGANGDVSGTAWDGYLSTYLSNFKNNVYTKAESDSKISAAVGSLAFLSNNTGDSFGPGTIRAGSTLSYACVLANWDGGNFAKIGRGSSPDGSWRCLGYCGSQYDNGGAATLFLRIS